jgi:hypothetical protein
MTQIKAFAIFVVIAFTADMAIYDGAYRHALGHSINNATWHVTHLHWTGFLGR